MMDFEDIGELGDEIAALETSLGGVAGMAAAFDAELRRVHSSFGATARTAGSLERSLSRGVARAIDGLVLDGISLSDALRDVADSMVNAAWRAAVRPVADHIGGAVTSGIGSLFGAVTPFAKGGSFSQGRERGVIGGPTAFPMRGGLGLMGEAGPEAVLPLSRGPDGALGVRMQGQAAPAQVVINISTPDVEGFRRSQSQIAAQMGRALSAGARNR